MTQRYGIDTSILVRLLTGDPPDTYEFCVTALTRHVEEDGHELFASNQVIGEAYIAVQHHYGVAKQDARDALVSVLTSGVVKPLAGRGVFVALKAVGGCGLFDRLISLTYRQADLRVLTLDDRMARLERTEHL